MHPTHAEMYQRLLESISMYSKKSLGMLESGAGDIPQWANDIVSGARTHMKDVTHFLRGQARHGIRYGNVSPKTRNHGRAYMATKNLREISSYADESLGYLERGAGHFPAWVENKLSIIAENMDLVGHWLENEVIEGRIYGQRGGGRFDAPRSVSAGALAADPMGRGSAARARRGRLGGGPGMGRGRGRRRRHRRHGVNIYPYWTLPYYHHEYYPIHVEPVIFAHITNVTARRDAEIKTYYPGISNANGVIGIKGSGFEGIQGGVIKIVFQIENIASSASAVIINHSPNEIEIAIPVSGEKLNNFALYEIGYYDKRKELVSLSNQFFSAAPYPFAPFGPMAKRRRRFSQATAAFKTPATPTAITETHTQKGELFYQPGFGSIAPGKSMTNPFEAGQMLPSSRMLEPHRQTMDSRMLGQKTRKYGVPGIPFPQPGWAGQAGVAQMPHPMRGGSARRMINEPVQTYGSLGYASMGDGSMDMAVRGARFSGTKKKKKIRTRRRRIR